MMRNYEQYLEDISHLTNLPIYVVRELLKIIRLVIGHEIYECMIENAKVYESLCAGIGKLSVNYNNATDDYDVSIKLSKDMKKVLDEVLDTQKSPLEIKLSEKLTSTIKEKFRSEILDE